MRNLLAKVTAYKFARRCGKSPLVALYIALALLAGTACGTTALEAVGRAEVRWYNATGLREHAAARRPLVFDVFGTFECGLVVPAASGCYVSKVDIILIDVQRPVAEIDRTAAHELGHRWGLEDGGVGVMGAQQSTPWSYCITADDIKAVCALYTCPWQREECGP